MAEPRRSAGNRRTAIRGRRASSSSRRASTRTSPTPCSPARTRALEAAGAVSTRQRAGRARNPPAIAIALDAAERAGKPYEGAVALGCVIRGETLHFEIVSQESARALHGPFGRAPHADRQRHTHRRYRRAGLGAGAPGARRQGRRCGACGACARPAQARVSPRVERMARDARRRMSARPTAAARRASPPCRRSIRWRSPAPV